MSKSCLWSNGIDDWSNLGVHLAIFAYQGKPNA